MPDSTTVTALLQAHQAGEEDIDALFDHLYDELYDLAHRQLRRLRPGDTMSTTALVHEAYLKLVDQSEADWDDRAHFFAVAATCMRHILLNYARAQSTEKRGGDRVRLSFEDGTMAPQDSAETLVMLDRALGRLAEQDERMARVVELRFFGGMTQKETATVLDVSVRTVRRDWKAARAWLSKALSDAGQDPEAEGNGPSTNGQTTDC